MNLIDDLQYDPSGYAAIGLQSSPEIYLPQIDNGKWVIDISLELGGFVDDTECQG